MLIDAHCHIKKSDEAKFLKHHDICVLVNCQTPQEFQFLKQFESEHFILSAGVHPWDRDEHALASMLEVLEQVRVVGEIGLDSVWCTVDPIQQNQVFEAQLEFAMNHKKPVLLHTKGEELAVLNHIKNYPNTYLVHWYSSEDYLEDYIVQDCYFTLGPSYLSDRAVHRVLEKVPMNRILVETDGLGALSWALDKPVDLRDWKTHLETVYADLAQRYGVSVQAIMAQLNRNFNNFLNRL